MCVRVILKYHKGSVKITVVINDLLKSILVLPVKQISISMLASVYLWARLIFYIATLPSSASPSHQFLS